MRSLKPIIKTCFFLIYFSKFIFKCLDLYVVFDPDLNCCLEGSEGAGREHCVGDLILQSDG